MGLEIFIGFMIILVVARFFGELATRVRLPSILGEVGGGIILGIAVLAWPGEVPILGDITSDRAFLTFIDMGIFFLMFTAGIEVTLGQLVKASGQGIPVAIGGVVVPLAMGIALGMIFVPDSNIWATQVLFLGVAMAITAVPISIRTLMDIGALNTRPGHVLVDAAVLDDIIGIILLSVLVGMVQTGNSPSISEIAPLVATAIGFLVLAGIIGYTVLPFVDRLLLKVRGPEMHFTIILVFGAPLAFLAEFMGMHFMIGAFVAGVLVKDRLKKSEAIVEEVSDKLKGVTNGFLAPIFFASRGLHIDFAAFQLALPFTLTLIGFAMASKLIGCSIPARLTGMNLRESLAVGIGMSGRGGVELVVASVALEAGVFSQPTPVPPVVAAMFSAVIFMAILTSLIAPIGLRLLLRDEKEGPAEPVRRTAPTNME